MEKPKSDRVVFSTRLKPDIIKKLKYLGVDEGKSVNLLLEEAIEMLLKARKK